MYNNGGFLCNISNKYMLVFNEKGDVSLRRLPWYALYPGLKVARSVFNNNGQVLLSAGAILTGRYIERLKTLGIQALYIEDGLAPDIEINDVITDETRIRAISLVRNFFEDNDHRTGGIIKRGAIMSRDMTETLSEIIDQLMENRHAVVNLVDIRGYDEYTFGHSVNVCVLSVLTGISLGYNRQRLFTLGMGTLLHDVGKILLPKEILNKKEELTTEDFEEIKRHCHYGYKLIKSGNLTDIVAASVILQHHERYDGQGYPKGLKGKQIHEFSRIAGISDTYDAVTVDRIYRKAIPPNEAWELISSSGGILFDQDISKAFLNHIAAYPVGTLVLLSSKEVGVVVENLKGFSKFPKVRVIFDAKGRYMEGYNEIWLHDQAEGLFIMRAVDDIKKVFFNDQLAVKA